METRGRHLLLELRGCRAETLDDLPAVEALMRAAALAAGATIVQAVFHRFAPQGVSGVVVIEESHLSVHTWPEYGYAAVDLYTCGDCAPQAAVDALRDGMGADSCEVMVVERGLPVGARSMRIADHHHQDRPQKAAI